MSKKQFEVAIDEAKKIQDLNELSIVFITIGKALAAYNPIQLAEILAQYTAEKMREGLKPNSIPDPLALAFVTMFDRINQMVSESNQEEREAQMEDWIEYETTKQRLKKQGILVSDDEELN